MSEIIEVALDPAEAYQRGAVDINFFASVALPDVFECELPYFYISIWQLLVNRDPKDVGKIIRFALGLPRGHAKTTFVKILICWLIVYDRFNFVLIVCATESLAENLLADINSILGSPNMEAIYGDWSQACYKDTAELKKAKYHNRHIILAAKGAGSALRGINLENDRPDIIFCDDMQSKENDDSPTDSQKLLSWFGGTLIKCLRPKGDRLIIYLGNMYSDNCILFKLHKNRKWISLITGAILADGSPLWPELHSLEDLQESYEHDMDLGLEAEWFAEVMNDPKQTSLTLLPNPLPRIEITEAEEMSASFITIDPAGFRSASDANEIVVHAVYNGVIHAVEHSGLLTKPDEIIKEALSLAAKWGSSLIGVEATGYQQTLAFWIRFWMEKLHITGIEVVELSPHGTKKETRIRQYIQECYAGTCVVSGDLIRADYLWQAMKYKIGKKDNRDDLLDAVAYAPDVRNEYWHLLKAPKWQSLAALDAIEVVVENTPF